MARKSSTINKSRVREEIACLKQVLTCLETEVARLDPTHNERHKMRLQSILGAALIKDIQDAADKVGSAFRACRSIKRETL